MKKNLNFILVILVVLLSISTTYFATKNKYQTYDQVVEKETELEKDVERMFVDKNLGISFDFPEEWGGVEVAKTSSFGWTNLKRGDNGDVFAVVAEDTNFIGDRGGTWVDGPTNYEECNTDADICSLFKSENGFEFVQEFMIGYYDETFDIPVLRFATQYPEDESKRIVISNINGSSSDVVRKDSEFYVSKDDLLIILNSLEFL